MDLGFGNCQRLKELSIHEFGHSFVNPITDTLPQQLITGTEHLFDSLKEKMSLQGYNAWKVCLYEHVRAGEVVVAELLGDTTASTRLRSEYIKDRGFIYLR